MAAFRDFKLLASLQQTLIDASFSAPTEIQGKAIPLLLSGQSLVGVAETGSGKTLAYALPILHLLKSQEQAGDKVMNESRPRALIVVPTRELGEQVSRVLKTFTHSTRLRVRTILGGTKMQVAKENVKGQFEVLVATPGRLTQMLLRRRIDLTETRLLVFDEADQMLDPGFLTDATKIVGACPKDLQIALFSATVSPSVEKLMRELVPDASILRTKGSSRLVSTLEVENLKVVNGKRFPLLETLLKKTVAGGTLIFTNTREQCDTLAAEMAKKELACVIYRGEMDKVKRRANLKAFRDGEIPCLISTDLASRGLDVDHVGRVINYHMPQHLENYLHRAGRTARAGRSGLVINFVTERDQNIMDLIKSVKAMPS